MPWQTGSHGRLVCMEYFMESVPPACSIYERVVDAPEGAYK